MTRQEVEGLLLRLPFVPESAGEARRRLDTWINNNTHGQTVRQDWRDDARLVLTELVGNSILHAAPLPDGSVEVGWKQAADQLHITVRDGGGSGQPQVQDAALMATGGRGLAIVEALADSWWVDQSDDATTTHALLV